ncbi:hypothetical protein [Acidisoma sp. 7E03]
MVGTAPLTRSAVSGRAVLAVTVGRAAIDRGLRLVDIGGVTPPLAPVAASAYAFRT